MSDESSLTPLLLRELLSEAIYCLEQSRPHIPKIYIAGDFKKSSLAARIESLTELAYMELGDDFEAEVQIHGL